MAVQAPANVWAGYIQCCCFFEQPKCPHSRLCFISGIKEPAQPLRAGFWASLVPYHNFELYTFSRQSIPAIHPMKTSLILPRTSNHLIFYKLFGRNFFELPLVLEKLLNTVKWSTFWESFIRVLTFIGWVIVH